MILHRLIITEDGLDFVVCNHILHVQKADLTFLSSLRGCSGVSGRSLEPGKMYSGGLKSTDGSPSLTRSENGNVRVEG